MKKLIFVLTLILLGYAVYQYGGPAFAKLDRTPPSLEVTEGLIGLGADPKAVSFKASDASAGLNYVSIEVEQQGKSNIVFEQKIDEPVKQIELRPEISGKSHGLVEGSLKLIFKVKDNSFFSNETVVTRDAILDFAKPQIQLLTQQFRAREGGAEFVMFKAKDSNLSDAGVRVGERKFPAVKANELDPGFAANSDIFGALFAIPFASKAIGPKTEIYANDLAGNETKLTLSFDLDPFTQVETTPMLKPAFVNEKFDEIIPGYERRTGKKVEIDRTSDAGLAKAFRLINEEYRAELEKILLDIMTKDKPNGITWNSIFIKPMPSATSSKLGEKRHYMLNDADAGHSVHCGLDLASVDHDSVHATADGKVVLAEEFGIYGNAVILSHGLGIYSIYGHLSSISTNVGDTVTKGFEIGRTGKTGLAGGDHLHYEIRIRGVPVTPIEWWDPKWMQDDLFGKIAGVRESTMVQQ